MSGLHALPDSKAAAALLVKQRRKRILSMQWKALTIIIDPVTALYLLGFLVLAVAFSREQLFANLQLEGMGPLDPVKTVNAFVLCVLWGGIWQVLQSPRYRFTYSDFLLHFMPINLQAYMRRAIVIQQMIRLLIPVTSLLLIALIQATMLEAKLLTWTISVLAVGAFAICDFALGLLVWHVFQQRLIVRILTVLAMVVCAWTGLVLGLMVEGMELRVLIGLLLLSAASIALFWWRLDTKGIDWQRVLTFGENKAWNGFLVRLVVGAGDAPHLITRPWVTPKFPPRVPKLPYRIGAVLRHQWRRYLRREKRNVLTSLVLYSLLLHSSASRAGIPFYEGISFVAVGMLIVYMLSDLFVDRLRQPVMQGMPWPVRGMIRSFRNATLWLLLPLLVPQLLMLLHLEYAWWGVIALVAGEALLYVAYLEASLAACVSQLQGHQGTRFVSLFYGLVFAGLAGLMIWQPVAAPVIGGFAWWQANRKK